MNSRHASAVLVTLAALSLSLAAAASFAQASGDSGCDARAAIAAALAVAPGGIDELRAVEIGGIPQWISVRGNDPANPILLFLHGGPGSPMMPESWTFQRPWEDFFTVVQWDQRGAGKTFAAAGQRPDTSMTIQRMQADTEELIQWLQRAYGKRKILLLGHSWGSVLGVRVAQHRPEWLHAYIGVGQVVDGRRNEIVGYRLTLAQAEATGDTAAIRALSPAYSDEDERSAQSGEESSVVLLLPQIAAVSFDDVTTFACPVFCFAGAHDADESRRGVLRPHRGAREGVLQDRPRRPLRRQRGARRGADASRARRASPLPGRRRPVSGGLGAAPMVGIGPRDERNFGSW